MKIRDVYTEFLIPKHLALHMLRVAAVGRWIAEGSRVPVDVSDITATLLLHDMGNLLKFDLRQGIGLFDADDHNLHYWLDIQNNMKTLYGNDEHMAVRKIAKKIGVGDRVFDLLTHMGSSHLESTFHGDDLALKIVSYADFRVAPSGFVSVKDRFADIMIRYAKSLHVLADGQKTLAKRDICLKLEKQITMITGVELNRMLSTKELEEKAHALLAFEV